MVKYRIHFAQDRMKRGRGDGGGKRGGKSANRREFYDSVLHDTEGPAGGRKPYGEPADANKSANDRGSRRKDSDRDERDQDRGGASFQRRNPDYRDQEDDYTRFQDAY